MSPFLLLISLLKKRQNIDVYRQNIDVFQQNIIVFSNGITPINRRVCEISAFNRWWRRGELNIIPRALFCFPAVSLILFAISCELYIKTPPSVCLKHRFR